MNSNEKAQEIIGEYGSWENYLQRKAIRQLKEHTDCNDEVSTAINFLQLKDMESKNHWQKCPICVGSGKIPAAGFTTMNVTQTCPTCMGKRIISAITGHPPLC